MNVPALYVTWQHNCDRKMCHFCMEGVGQKPCKMATIKLSNFFGVASMLRCSCEEASVAGMEGFLGSWMIN